MRCLLPKRLLDRGFFSVSPQQNDARNKRPVDHFCDYSWSGQRKVPSYLNQLVFPEDFFTALRTIAMQEHELLQVSSMVEEVFIFSLFSSKCFILRWFKFFWLVFSAEQQVARDEKMLINFQ